MINTIATAFLLIGLGLSFWQFNVISGKEVAAGRVTALEAHSSGKGTVYTLVAQFHDTTGQERIYRAAFSSSSPGYEVGDSIRIWFERDNPKRCGVLSFGYRFGVAWILICIGLAIAFTHWGWKAGNRWLEAHYETTVPARFFSERTLPPGQ